MVMVAGIITATAAVTLVLLALVVVVAVVAGIVAATAAVTLVLLALVTMVVPLAQLPVETPLLPATFDCTVPPLEPPLCQYWTTCAHVSTCRYLPGQYYSAVQPGCVSSLYRPPLMLLRYWQLTFASALSTTSRHSMSLLRTSLQRSGGVGLQPSGGCAELVGCSDGSRVAREEATLTGPSLPQTQPLPSRGSTTLLHPLLLHLPRLHALLPLMLTQPMLPPP